MKNKILFITATHGNESFSIPVFERLEKKYPRDIYGYDWIVGNHEAVKKDVRFIDTDLNRAAPGKASSDKYEEKRAAEIIELSKNYDFVIDVHGTLSDFGIVKIIPYPTYQNLFFAGLIPVQRNVIWYAEESTKSGPLVQFCHCPALELECGPKNEKHTATQLEKVIEKILINRKNQNKINISTLQEQNFYAVYGKVEQYEKKMQDFVLEEINGEQFYPFMSQTEYPGIACYKMKKINIEESFLVTIQLLARALRI